MIAVVATPCLNDHVAPLFDTSISPLIPSVTPVAASAQVKPPAALDLAVST